MAVRSGHGCDETTDYMMSEKFGMDWKSGESRRMTGFIVVMAEMAASSGKPAAGDGRLTFR